MNAIDNTNLDICFRFREQNLQMNEIQESNNQKYMENT
jgi:hypothetical protein